METLSLFRHLSRVMTDDGETAISPGTAIELRAPTADDARLVHALVRESRPLEENSLYCNLLQCTHFAGTSVVAVENGALVGFVSGYIIPGRPDSLFVWQVAVSRLARGRGLGKQMLGGLLARLQGVGVSYMETTITPGNSASWGLFRSFAKQGNAQVHESILFESQRHFGGGHESEHLLRIGPFAPLGQ